ncbi:MAG: hypothetical protein HDS67_02275 [Bacteroidales bacterium]|nr:hypothetical protein [Bacteroidales bacterium]
MESIDFNSIGKRSFLLSSELALVSVPVPDGEPVIVSLSAEAQAEPLYSQRLWPWKGKLTLFRLDEIAEEFMRSHSQPLMIFTLSVSPSGASAFKPSAVRFPAIHFPRLLIGDPERSLTTRFLHSEASRIPQGVTPAVTLLRSPGDNSGVMTWNASFIAPDGPRDYTLTAVMSPASAPYVRTFRAPLDQLAEGAGAGTADLASLHVHCGDRVASFFVDPSLSDRSFVEFRNTFNVPERLYTLGAVTFSQGLEISTAAVGTELRAYDRRITDSYKAVTLPLSEPELDTVRQLGESWDVSVPFFPDPLAAPVLMPAVVTETELSFSDSTQEKQTASITWQLADVRPAMAGCFSPDIFKSQFNRSFL